MIVPLSDRDQALEHGLPASPPDGQRGARLPKGPQPLEFRGRPLVRCDDEEFAPCAPASTFTVLNGKQGGVFKLVPELLCQVLEPGDARNGAHELVELPSDLEDEYKLRRCSLGLVSHPKAFSLERLSQAPEHGSENFLLPRGPRSDRTVAWIRTTVSLTRRGRLKRDRRTLRQRSGAGRATA